MKDSLIFDLDGTLWDSTKQIKIVWNNVAQKYKIDLNKISIEAIMGLSNSEIISNFFNNDTSLGNSFLDECQKNENDYLSINGGNIYPSTMQTIQTLSKKYNLFIVSNCQQGYIETFLKFYNLNNYFIDFECSGNTKLSKTSNIKLLMERNNIKTSIYIGDTENDYNAAINSNNRFIWASYGFGNCNKYDYRINDIKELLNIL